MVNEAYDLIVLGTGPAGMAAGIYAGRYDMKTLVIGKEIGGATSLAGEIENYPGFVGSGVDLMKKFEEQAKSFGATFVMGNVEKVEKLASRKGSSSPEELNRSAIGKAHASHGDLAAFEVTVDGKVFRGMSVISGLGSEHRKLGIPGEKEFLGKGVSYCATCDGNFFRGKTVSVVGGSDSAAKAAIYLASICKKVYVSYRKEKMRAEPVNLDNLMKMKNVEIVYNTKPVEIVGEAKVTGLKLEATDGKKLAKDLIGVDGVFIEIGSTPVTQIVEGLGVELENGYIKVDKEGRTNVAGLFAAGDGTNNPFKQAITAAADGSLAAKAAYNFVRLGKG
jgi:thioredoxin reductase (NADPH)